MELSAYLKLIKFTTNICVFRNLNLTCITYLSEYEVPQGVRGDRGRGYWGSRTVHLLSGVMSSCVVCRVSCVVEDVYSKTRQY